MKERNLVEILLNQADRYQTRTLFRVKKEGRYSDVSWSSVLESVTRVALALERLGIHKGECIGLLSENRPEWVYADLGTAAMGAVTVPLYPTASLKDIEYVLNHCEAKLLFVSTQDQADRITALSRNLGRLHRVVVFSPGGLAGSVSGGASGGDGDRVQSLKELMSSVSLDSSAVAKP